jgi:hypothetical protein
MYYMQGNQPNMPNMMAAEPNLPAKSLIEETKKHRTMYPEVLFKLEPFITTTCDAIEASGVMPTQQELDDITDDIYDDFCAMYPDMANYMKSHDNDSDNPEAVPAQFTLGGFRPGRFGRFRRRGIGRDLITALLLSRLFGRRSFTPFFPF